MEHWLIRFQTIARFRLRKLLPGIIFTSFITHQIGIQQFFLIIILSFTFTI